MENEFLTLDQFWEYQNEAHLQIVDEFRALNQSPEANQEYWTKNMSEWYEGLILDAKKAYYNSGKPIMDDITHDTIENCLKLIKPNSKVLKQVGAEIGKR